MKYVKLDVKTCSVEEFVSFWSQFYNEGQYPDSIYENNLRKGKKLRKDNIKPLLEWKNGRPLSKNKEKILIK